MHSPSLFYLRNQYMHCCRNFKLLLTIAAYVQHAYIYMYIHAYVQQISVSGVLFSFYSWHICRLLHRPGLTELQDAWTVKTLQLYQ